MRPRLHRFAGRAFPFAIIAGTFACSPMLSSPPDYGVRPVSTAPNPNVPADMGYYSSAVDAIKKRDYGVALNFLQAARASDPNSARVLNAFGVVYDKLGRFDLSTRYYAQAKAADPQSPIVARNAAYSQVLQHLLNGGVAPQQLAAAGPAPNPPVVIETRTEILPGVARVATPVVGSGVNQSGTSGSELNAENGGQSLDRTILEAKVDVSEYRPEGLVDATFPVKAEQLPEVKPFAVAAQTNVLQAHFLFPSQLQPAQDVVAKTSPAVLTPVDSDAHVASIAVSHNVVAAQPEPERAIAPQPPVLVKSPSLQLEANSPGTASAQPQDRPTSRLTVAQLVRSNETVPNLVPQATALAALSAQPGRLTLAIVDTNSAARSSQSPVARRDVTAPVALSRKNAMRLLMVSSSAHAHGARAKLAAATTPMMAKRPVSAKRVQYATLQPSVHASGRPAAVSASVASARLSGAVSAAKFALLTHHPLVIVNASARKGGDDSIRRALIRHNWTVAQGRIDLTRKASYTTLFYQRADYAVARALARTLDLPMHLIPNGCHCVGLRLVIGTNALNRRYSELEYAGPHHMLSATATNLTVGLQGTQRW